MSSFDLDQKFLDARRSAAGGNGRGYDCPLCSQNYRAWPKLLEHAQQAHRESSEVTEFAADAEAKKRFVQRAQNKASNSKATTDSPTHKRPNENPSTSTHAGSNIALDDVSRPESAVGYSSSAKRIDDIGRLSLEQDKTEEPTQSLSPINNPRKRGAQGDSISPQSATEASRTGPTNTRARNWKNLGGNSFGRESAVSNQQDIHPDDKEFRRSASVSKSLLWNPNTDPPNATRTPRREKHSGHAKATSRRAAPFKTFAYSSNELEVYGDNNKPLVLEPHRGRSSMEPRNDDYNGLEGETRHPKGQTLIGNPSSPVEDFHDFSDKQPQMILQPETRPISHEQLVVEVKGIYAGLVMVEAKCIDIDERQTAAAQELDPNKKVDLKDDQYQSLIALHKQLLHEHHDFFLASQHPSASPALSRLAAKYSMPARMWRHGIHAFLEVLRHRLPLSLEHMLTFIYIAYSMMALLYETVSTFEDTWIECLGDLGRYRMAIEHYEPKDREVWSNVARFWYNKAADKSPNIGRLYHHLAILARPYTLEQLSLYARSLTCVTPFESARGSIMTLFDPILQGKDPSHRRFSSFEIMLIRAHGIRFTNSSPEPGALYNVIDHLRKSDVLENYIKKAGPKFKENGVYTAISNIATLFEYWVSNQASTKPAMRLIYERAKIVNAEKSKVVPVIPADPENLPPSNGPPASESESTFLGSPSPLITLPSRLCSVTLAISLRRTNDRNVDPLVHVYLVFLWSLIIVQQACKYFEGHTTWKLIEKDMPWMEICLFLNALAGKSGAVTANPPDKGFPKSKNQVGRPLPEDFVMRGQLYTQWYFPEKWFEDGMVDDDERSLEKPSMEQDRVDRILWLGQCIASAERWIRYDAKTNRFLQASGTPNDLLVNVKPEQISFDQDSVMSGVTTSRDPSMDSLVPSKVSTRASTPIDVQGADSPHVPGTPKALDAQLSAEDRMENILERNQREASVDDFDIYVAESSPQSNVVDTGMKSPEKSYESDFLPDTHKLQEINAYDLHEVVNIHRV